MSDNITLLSKELAVIKYAIENEPPEKDEGMKPLPRVTSGFSMWKEMQPKYVPTELTDSTEDKS